MLPLVGGGCWGPHSLATSGWVAWPCTLGFSVALQHILPCSMGLCCVPDAVSPARFLMAAAEIRFSCGLSCNGLYTGKSPPPHQPGSYKTLQELQLIICLHKAK